jgi:hypothetical protein
VTPDELHLRDEILQVMFWLRGEGFGEQTTPRQLSVFLPSIESELQRALDQMAADGLVGHDAPGSYGASESYALTEVGLNEGGRRFTEEFADAGLGAGGHGKCAPGCDCELHGSEECTHHHHD